MTTEKPKISKEDDEKIRRAGKHIERAMGYPRYELTIFEIVYCHALDKFVDHGACDGCKGNNGNYRSMWGQQMCSKANDKPPHSIRYEGRAWTSEELVAMLEKERKRILKLQEVEMKDREEFGPIHIDTPEEIAERERIVRDLHRVSPEDMFRPFTI